MRTVSPTTRTTSPHTRCTTPLSAPPACNRLLTRSAFVAACTIAADTAGVAAAPAPIANCSRRRRLIRKTSDTSGTRTNSRRKVVTLARVKCGASVLRTSASRLAVERVWTRTGSCCTCPWWSREGRNDDVEEADADADRGLWRAIDFPFACGLMTGERCTAGNDDCVARGVAVSSEKVDGADEEEELLVGIFVNAATDRLPGTTVCVDVVDIDDEDDEDEDGAGE